MCSTMSEHQGQSVKNYKKHTWPTRSIAYLATPSLRNYIKKRT
jgi:hypothetical protein